MLEHSVWNLILTGISRSLSHELVRHRAGTGFSQLSQRYVDESDVAFIPPPALREEVQAASEEMRDYFGGEEISTLRLIYFLQDADPSPEVKAGAKWLLSCSVAKDSYAHLNDYLQERDAGEFASKRDARKAARQAARSVIPNAAETKIFLTLNGRAARNILEQRCSRHADAEIRGLANLLYEALAAESPLLFDDYVKTQLGDGTFELSTAHRKV